MNKKRKLFQTINVKIPLLIIIILLISFQFIGVYFIGQLETQSVKNFKDQINVQIDFLINNVSPILTEENSEGRSDRLVQALETFSSSNRTDIRIINREEVIEATNFDYQLNSIGTKTNELAIKKVLVSRVAFAEETHDTDSKTHSYNVIKPILSTDSSKVVGAVAVKANMNRVYEQTASTAQLFLRSAAFAGVASVILAIVLSQGLTRPIEEIRQQAIRISEGVYNYPSEVFGQDELGELAETVNELAIKVKDAQELTESERQRLDGVLRHMTDGVIATDRRGHILLVNERALQLLGIEQQKAMGMSIIRLLKLKETHTLTDLMSEDTEVLMHRSDGGTKSILKGEFSIIRRETGFITGLVCVLTDVTEQEKTEQERRDFVSNVSHELRTPLTSIKSYTEALSEGAWKDGVVAPEFLNVIQSEADRMMRMISDLLDLSKIDGGQYKLESEYVDFKRLVNHILNRFEVMLQNGEMKKKYTIVRDLTSRDVYVEIDQDRMTQVIDNIMNNAIKYSPDGGVVTVKLEDLHSSIVVSVSDQGLGIPPKDIPHLFDRFYRVDKARSREQGGTGLGLAISKEVIELHGGKIWAESVENQGSTFTFELPYANFGVEDEGWDDV